MIHARHLLIAGDAAGSASVLEQYAERDPLSPPVLALLGYSRFCAGHPGEALAAVRQALSLDGRSTEALCYFSIVAMHAGRRREASVAGYRAFRQARRLRPGARDVGLPLRLRRPTGGSAAVDARGGRDRVPRPCCHGRHGLGARRCRRDRRLGSPRGGDAMRVVAGRLPRPALRPGPRSPGRRGGAGRHAVRARHAVAGDLIRRRARRPDRPPRRAPTSADRAARFAACVAKARRALL